MKGERKGRQNILILGTNAFARNHCMWSIKFDKDLGQNMNLYKQQKEYGKKKALGLLDAYFGCPGMVNKSNDTYTKKLEFMQLT